VGKFILALIFLAVPLYALIEAIRSPGEEVRFMSKWLWALCVVFFGIIGAVLWFVYGRPRTTAPGGEGNSGGGGISLPPGLGPRPKGPLAPDDDPDFLKRLDEQTWAARMEKLRKERGDAAPQESPPATAPPAPPQPAPNPAPEPGPDPS
jgi:hypothetical protein